MKKLFLGFAVFGMLALTSCAKDWTCSCKYVSEGGGTTIPAESYEFKDLTKKEATDSCKEKEASKEGVGTKQCNLIGG